jgi:Na+/H+ antiporter NhaC
VQASTGLFASDTDVFEYGPLMGYITLETSRAITEWHHEIGELMWWIIGLHVLAAMVYLHVKRENLITPMLTGNKPAAQVPPAERIGSSRLWLALLLVAIVAGGLYIAVQRAPVVDTMFAF